MQKQPSRECVEIANSRVEGGGRLSTWKMGLYLFLPQFGFGVRAFILYKIRVKSLSGQGEDFAVKVQKFLSGSM